MARNTRNNSKGSKGHGAKPDTRSKQSSSLGTRNLMDVNPNKEQFEPTDANPISQRKRMAGA